MSRSDSEVYTGNQILEINGAHFAYGNTMYINEVADTFLSITICALQRKLRINLNLKKLRKLPITYYD